MHWAGSPDRRRIGLYGGTTLEGWKRSIRLRPLIQLKNGSLTRWRCVLLGKVRAAGRRTYQFTADRLQLRPPAPDAHQRQRWLQDHTRDGRRDHQPRGGRTKTSPRYST